MASITPNIFQAAKDVRKSQDTLVDVFERIENFLRRLEVYTQVPPTAEMMDTIIQILAEVLTILGIAMKEIRQGRMSEWFSTSMPPLAKRCLEKYGKRLIGRTDMEDALKKLDKLTQEEARMATAEVLRATHTINEGVRVVKEQVAEVIDGTQIIFSQGWEMLNIDCSDGREAKRVMKQIERSSFNPINAD
jgi:hypothetical protein